MRWLFNFFRKSSNSIDAINSDLKFFHGHDLSIWNYLGLTELKYTFDNGNTASRAFVYYFCDKEDFAKRSFHLSDNNFKDHPMVGRYILPWSAGDHEFYYPVTCIPSSWLKTYMGQHYAQSWSTEKKWHLTDEAKHEYAMHQQALTKHKEGVIEVVNNVIKVDFKNE